MTHTNGTRRRDVFTTKVQRYIPKRKNEAEDPNAKARGVDSAGRFIGHGALARALRFFWASRPGQEDTIVSGDFDFRSR